MDNITFIYNEDFAKYDIFFVVVIAKHNGKWVMVKHKERDTWEIPGGKCETGETFEESAKRELYEETGAKDFSLEELFVFEANDMYGLVYYSDIESFEALPESEIEEVKLFNSILDIDWTYDKIQPYLVSYYLDNF